MLLITINVLSAVGLIDTKENTIEFTSTIELHSDESDCGCFDQFSDTEYGSDLYQPSDHTLNYMFYKFQIRSYLVYLPPSYDGSNPLPLVITLHGCPSNASDIVNRFKISDKAAQEGFIAVYPNGNKYIWKYFFEYKEFCKELCWNGRFCCGDAFTYEVDDVGFIRALINKLQKTYAIDQNRIFIAGHSNGGIMAHLLGAELSDLVAASAPNSGTVGGKADSTSDYIMPPAPEYPVSVVIFHGMKDNVFQYNGGKVFNFWYPDVLSVNDSISFWVENNKCDTTPDIYVSPNGNVTRLTYRNGDAGTEVICYLDKNGGHYWFGESSDPNKEMNTTDLMWEFFAAHPKQ
jgi:polyhydroxybutyrate depolymerase